MIVPLALALLAMNHAGGKDVGIGFTDVTAASGLVATMTSGTLPSSQIVEVKGGGLALIDFDRDGDLDIFMPNGATLADSERGPGAKLFRNDSTVDGIRFVDVTASSGIALTRWSFGVAVGDVNADGLDDIFVSCFGPDVMLRNRGDGTFEDVSAPSGIAAPERAQEWGTGCAFADLDGDGDLDLYVVNYLAFDATNLLPTTKFRGLEVMSGPKGLPAQRDRLFLNDGTGVFTDVTDASGIGAAKPSYGLNLAILDFSGDGKLDIFVGNDSHANFLFVQGDANEANGQRVPFFTDEGMKSGVATNMEGLEQATMGIAVADVDGNGRPDIFTTNFSSDTNTLHLNLDGTFFDDRTSQFGFGAVSRPYLGWATAFVDFDHDGDEDVLVVNGHVYPQATKQSFDSDYEQRPLLMVRKGRRFEALTEAGAWKLEPHRDRTAVFADLDRDGDVDVVIAELNGPLRVLRNDRSSATAKNWLVVEPRDARRGHGDRHAVGAALTVRSTDADGSERVQRRWNSGGGPFQSTLAPEMHVGFPIGTSKVSLELRWPDGTVERRENIELGQRLTFERVGERSTTAQPVAQ
ncbi:MAG: CRTAC1 family protein [Phycisphaerae bacterium]|nr:CRTAC1 family protein [Phycisphaerae bacterium]